MLVQRRCLQKCPVAFLKCDVAVPAIRCAVAASTLEHRDANLSVMKFLKGLINCATEKVTLTCFNFVLSFLLSGLEFICVHRTESSFFIIIVSFEFLCNPVT